MKKTDWPVFFTAGLIFLIIAGYAGDAIFNPVLMNFSFRVFSIYSVAVLFLIAALVIAQKEE